MNRLSNLRHRGLTNRRTAVGAFVIGATMTMTVVGCVAPDKTGASQDGLTPAWAGMSTTKPTSTATPPVAADFVVGVIVTQQKCFGSAGCNYRYTINPQYVGTKPLPDKTTVVFTVAGGEQNQVGNFTIDSDGIAQFDRETSISGDEGAELRATVTQVIPGR